MQKQKNVYRRLIDTALAMPKYEPPKVEPVKSNPKLAETLTRKRSIREDAELAYNFIVATAKTRTTLSKSVPLSKLHETMATHVMKFTGEAIIRGGLPLKVFVIDRFATFLDFGDGRVLKIAVRIDEMPKAQSLARFVVERATEKDFETYNGENEIKDAVIWQEKVNEKQSTLGVEK